MSKSIQQRRLEFLEDTVKYYSEDPSRRATTKSIDLKDGGKYDNCCYLTADGRKCAIGRHIPPANYSDRIESWPANGGVVFNRLPHKIQQLGSDFLVEVQRLHDGAAHWDKAGITPAGLDHVTFIKTRYCHE